MENLIVNNMYAHIEYEVKDHIMMSEIIEHQSDNSIVNK